MLSSQPRRRFGDAEDDENSRPEFALTSQDWPASPPPKKTVNMIKAFNPPGRVEVKPTTAGSHFAATSSTTSSASSSSSSGARAVAGPKLATATSSAPKLAPIFGFAKAKANPPPPASAKLTTLAGNLPPLNATPSSNASSSAWPAPARSKRVNPWENLEADTKKSKAASSRSGPVTNYAKLSGPGGKAEGSGKSWGGLAKSGDATNIAQKLSLSPEQQMVVSMVVGRGESVFFTGSAGTGKSVLLRELIAGLKKKFKGQDEVAVTASTGMAACNVGGQTIHSFAGIGLGIDPAPALITRIRKNTKTKMRWQKVKVLIIDEVSMVDGDLFDKLDTIAKNLKAKPKEEVKPFGGIQLVVTGDFFQLPPVSKGSTAKFAFDAKAWGDAIPNTVNLSQVFRQKDEKFVRMLNEMRFGMLTPESIAEFKKLARDPAYDDGIDPTELFPTRLEVDRANGARMKALQGETVSFRADDYVSPDEFSQPGKEHPDLANMMVPSVLELKKDAQVMLLKNLDEQLVNGTIGKVIGFGYDEPEEYSQDEIAMMEAQGNFVDKKPKLKKAPDGQVELPPKICWQLISGGSVVRTMDREEFKTENTKGQKKVHRKQYPLVLAWAMSIHKSQGQTLSRVKVDLGKVFEKGQSYVALSRATSLQGLQVLRFEANKVAAHPKVVQWSKGLRDLNVGPSAY